MDFDFIKLSGVNTSHTKCLAGEVQSFFIERPVTRADLAAIHYFGSAFQREAPDGTVDFQMQRGTAGTDIPGCVRGIYTFRAMEDGQYICFTAANASALGSRKFSLAAGESITIDVGHVAVADTDAGFELIAPEFEQITITGPCLGLEVWRTDTVSPDDSYTDILRAWATDPENPSSPNYAGG